MARTVRPSGVAEQVDRGQKPDIYKAAIERLEEIVTAQAARIEALEEFVQELKHEREAKRYERAGEDW